MDLHSLELLEYETFKLLLKDYAQTPLGRSALLSLSPSTEQEVIERELEVVDECIQFQREVGRLSIPLDEDPSATLKRLAVANLCLDGKELLQIQRLLSVGQAIKQELKPLRTRFVRLYAITASIADFEQVACKIRENLLPTGEVDDRLNPRLRQIRHEITIIRTRIYRKLERLIEQAGGEIRDDFITQRSGRFVIPVKQDLRGRVPGVVHALSSSGATAFVEPLATIEDNNELVRLRELEEEEISKVLFTLSEELRKSLPALQELASTLAKLDTIVARANFAKDYNCVRPRINVECQLELVQARHPLLEQAVKKDIVPISLKLDATTNAMVISGPNAGGKTVVLKTVGLLVLLAQSGIPVPAKEALLPIFASVFADIGDQQSLSANLSTFSSHIANIRRIAENLTAPALVLLDEVGTGTDPEEGAAIAVATVDYFKNKRALVLASTHYATLKQYAAQTPGVLNASVEFDEVSLRPTYRLLLGISGTSSGIEIARRLGLQQEILDKAVKTLDLRDIYQANFLKILKTESDKLEVQRAELEREKLLLAQLRKQIEEDAIEAETKRRSEFEAAIEAVIAKFEKMSLEYISELEASAKLTRQREKYLSRLKREAKLVVTSQVKETDPVLEEYKVGDIVRTELGQQGRIEEIREDEVFVRVGAMLLRASAASLKLIERPRKVPLPKGITLERKTDGTFLNELNVIGYKADDVTSAVDKFLDTAFLEGFEKVKIVHGVGVLKRIITEYLKSHPHVAEFHQAGQSEGGAAATTVELKR